MLRKKIVYLDSGNQLTSSINTWSNQLDINFQEDYDRVTVLQAQIPVSYYVIGQTANKFTLTEGLQSVSITIPASNYNVYNFATVVGNLMTTNSPNGYTYTITYPNNYTSPDTGLFTYRVNSIAKTVSLTFPRLSPIADQFGFYLSSTNYFSVSGMQQVLISTAVVNFIPENSLLIHANIVDGETTSELSDVLISIYGSNVQPYSTITYINPCPLETSRRLASRDRNLIFSITDENNGQIFMNGQNILMVLMFYKEDSTPRSIEQYIAMKTKLLELEFERDSQAEIDQVVESKGDKSSLTEGDMMELINPSWEFAKKKETELLEKEKILNAREETLKIREESINNLDTNKNNEQIPTDAQSAFRGDKIEEETNIKNQEGQQNQETIPRDWEEEILD
jgi:hypothetical protein